MTATAFNGAALDLGFRLVSATELAAMVNWQLDNRPPKTNYGIHYDPQRKAIRIPGAEDALDIIFPVGELEPRVIGSIGATRALEITREPEQGEGTVRLVLSRDPITPGMFDH